MIQNAYFHVTIIDVGSVQNETQPVKHTTIKNVPNFYVFSLRASKEMR